MSVLLIRHGQTKGNLERRYIGCRTDEGLCEAGRAALRDKKIPPVKRVFASPMRRCIETAAILFPGAEPIAVPDFRECDFGAFEGFNYSELNGRADYQAWIDSGGELPFPRGESRAAFAARCARAFDELRPRLFEEDCALVVHGGTIMAIMEKNARPQAGYFDFQVSCGAGYILEEDGTYRAL